MTTDILRSLLDEYSAIVLIVGIPLEVLRKISARIKQSTFYTYVRNSLIISFFFAGILRTLLDCYDKPDEMNQRLLDALKYGAIALLFALPVIIIIELNKRKAKNKDEKKKP